MYIISFSEKMLFGLESKFASILNDKRVNKVNMARVFSTTVDELEGL